MFQQKRIIRIANIESSYQKTKIRAKNEKFCFICTYSVQTGQAHQRGGKVEENNRTKEEPGHRLKT